MPIANRTQVSTSILFQFNLLDTIQPLPPATKSLTSSTISKMPGTFGVLTPGTFPILSPREPTCDCYSPDSVDTLLPTPRNKLALDNDYFSIPVMFDGQADFRGRMNDFVMELPNRPKRSAIRDPSCGSSPALIQIVTQEELEQSTASNPTRSEPSSSTNPPIDQDTGAMVYNEYGELVDENTLHTPQIPQDMTVTQLIRVINKAYHHDVSASSY